MLGDLNPCCSIIQLPKIMWQTLQSSEVQVKLGITCMQMSYQGDDPPQSLTLLEVWGSCWRSLTPISNHQFSHKICTNGHQTQKQDLKLIISTSFGDYSFCRRTCQDYIGKEPKVYKKCNIVDIRHEPKGRQPTYQQNQGPKEWKTRPNSNQTISTPCNTAMGQVQDIIEDNPTKLGQFGASHGVATPPPSPFGPSFGRWACRRQKAAGSHRHMQQAERNRVGQILSSLQTQEERQNGWS